MAVNKYAPHVLVLPEDDANRQLANGFLLRVRWPNRIQVLPPSGGWVKVLEDFRQIHIAQLRRFLERRLILLLDFDQQIDERTERVRGQIPPDLLPRVYMIGTSSEPEALRTGLGRSLESIGQDLASDCMNGVPGTWDHALLAHTQPERNRMAADVGGMVFEPAV